jgi:hypothetical protein
VIPERLETNGKGMISWRRGGGAVLGLPYPSSNAQLAHFLNMIWTDLPEQELPGKGLWQRSTRPLGTMRIWPSGKDETLT